MVSLHASPRATRTASHQEESGRFTVREHARYVVVRHLYTPLRVRQTARYAARSLTASSSFSEKNRGSRASGAPGATAGRD